MTLPPHLRPIMVNRIATCLNCGARLHARAGDWVAAYSQPVQQWVHWSERSTNRYCNRGLDDFVMGEVDVTTVEWVKDFTRNPLRRGGEALIVVDFHRPKHRREYRFGNYPYALAS